MLGFLKRMLGGSSARSQDQEHAAVDYNGYRIVPVPRRESEGFRVQGRIEKTVDGEVRTHTFVRADVYHGVDDTVAVIVQKGQRIVDEQGDAIFAERPD